MTTRKLDINAAAEIVGLPPSIGAEFWGSGTEGATLGDHREVSAPWGDWVAFADAVLRIDRMLVEQQEAARPSPSTPPAWSPMAKPATPPTA